MSKKELGPFRDGKLHVLAERCETCIFRPGNLMMLEPGRVKDMVTRCQSTPGGNIPCHETLGGEKSICRGFWDGYHEQDPIMVLAVEREIIEEVVR